MITFVFDLTNTVFGQIEWWREAKENYHRVTKPTIRDRMIKEGFTIEEINGIWREP